MKIIFPLLTTEVSWLSLALPSSQHFTLVFLVTIASVCGILQVFCIIFAINSHINNMVPCLDWLHNYLDVFDLSHTGSLTWVLGCPPLPTFNSSLFVVADGKHQVKKFQLHYILAHQFELGVFWSLIWQWCQQLSGCSSYCLV